jgi:phospholipid N-methyltransferase
LREHVLFLSKFLLRPFKTGAVVPSSDALGECITSGIGLEQAQTVVELGPGTGVFTRTIVRRAAPGARIMAVEIDDAFARVVKERCPRVEVVHGPAEDLPRYLDGTPADCIVSSLPFAGFSVGLQTRILDAVHAVLRPGGWFTTFAYVHAAWLPPGQRFRRLLGRSFSSVERSAVVWNNVPPAFVYRCRK